MSIITATEQIKKMNTIFEEWRSQFENKPEVNFWFTLNKNDMLLLENVVLCPLGDVDFDSMTFDFDTVYFNDKSNEFEIGIEWTFDGPPTVAFIRKCQNLYCKKN